MPRLTLAAALTFLPGLAAAQTELTYMMWGDPPEIAVWETLVADFEAAHPDISVKVEVSDWDSYWDKLRVLAAGGDAPDVFAMDAPLFPDWQARGAFLDLSPFVAADPAALDGIYEGPLSSYRLADGSLWGLPRDFQTIVLYYNADMFAAAGVEPPTPDWTLDDLRAAAKALTLDTDGDGATDQWGLATEFYDMEPFWGPAVYANGGDIVSEDGTQTLLTQGPARDAFALVNGLLNEDRSTMTEEDLESYGYDGFLAGVAAMTFSGHWVIPGYADLPFQWGVAPVPSGPAGRATLVNSAGIVGSATTEHPEAAWEFMRYVVSPEGQTTLASLGFAIPVQESVATGPAYLDQPVEADHALFVDALDYARVKPSFLGYEEWSGIVGEALNGAWTGEWSVDEALDEIDAAADDALGG